MKKCFDLKEAVNMLFGGGYTVEHAKAFIKEKIDGHSILSPSVSGKLKTITLEYEREVYRSEKRASVYLDPDSKYQLKTPESIIEKIWRSLNDHKEGRTQPEYTINNFPETMEDILRFRILCNYLYDVEQLKNILPNEMGPEFQVYKEPKDFIKLDPEMRKKGHRAVHFIFQAHHNQRKYLFEVQLMTLLQNAWDRKDHSIVYESKRTGNVVPLEVKMRSYAMSEMLYVADDYFNELLLKKVKNDS